MAERLSPERLENWRSNFGERHWRNLVEYIIPGLFSHIDAVEAELVTATSRADALFERKLPCREAEIAQARYERAETERGRYFRALLDIVEGPEDENPYRVACEALQPAGEVE